MSTKRWFVYQNSASKSRAASTDVIETHRLFPEDGVGASVVGGSVFAGVAGGGGTGVGGGVCVTTGALAERTPTLLVSTPKAAEKDASLLRTLVVLSPREAYMAAMVPSDVAENPTAFWRLYVASICFVSRVMQSTINLLQPASKSGNLCGTGKVRSHRFHTGDLQFHRCELERGG